MTTHCTHSEVKSERNLNVDIWKKVLLVWLALIIWMPYNYWKWWTIYNKLYVMLHMHIIIIMYHISYCIIPIRCSVAYQGNARNSFSRYSILHRLHKMMNIIWLFLLAQISVGRIILCCSINTEANFLLKLSIFLVNSYNISPNGSFFGGSLGW